jgi:hypothetical protein
MIGVSMNAEDRPAIPAQIKRAVLVEAGHRCAIPTCRATTMELAHIVPWAKVREHTFENLIALCPNCHTRFDKGEIDHQAMAMYKENLALLNNRYGEFERRLFTILAETKETLISVGAGGDILLSNAIKDGLLVDTNVEGMGLLVTSGDGKISRSFRTQFVYTVTPKGLDFIERFASGETLE